MHAVRWPVHVLAAMAGVGVVALHAQQAPQFRGDASLVRLDAYVTAGGTIVTGLTADDFEVLEDGAPQTIESFEFVEPRAATGVTRREPTTVAEARDMARDADSRIFVLFLDVPHVDRVAAFRVRDPLRRMLGRLIAPHDILGMMTPHMLASDVTLTRRTDQIESMLSDWRWGERGQLFSRDPREDEVRYCYMDMGESTVADMLAKYRAGRTVAALEDLVVYLEGLREERKFVIVLSEGWYLMGRRFVSPRPRSTAPTPRRPGGPPSRVFLGGQSACPSEVTQLGVTDNVREFQRLLQRANRANVSFYPVDARGLTNEVVEPPPSFSDRNHRPKDLLRALAEVTDGFPIIDTNDVEPWLERIVQDTGAYYLLGYYSTNTKLDGGYRALTVRVKRRGVDVRARPGYRAATEEELAVARRAAAASTITVRPKPTLEGVAFMRGPSTGLDYVPADDAAYRRTERIRFEVPRGDSDGTVSAQLLGRDGQPLTVALTVSERVDPQSQQRLVVADLTLASLAQGEYVLEVVIERGDQKESAAYGFQLVP